MTPMSKNYWKRLGTKTLFTHPRITIVEDEVVLPTGKTTEYVRYEGLNDYVTVIAERGDKIVMVKEYSYPHNTWLYQFPEGNIETDEDPAVAAARELREEAGLTASDYKLLGTNLDHHRRTTVKNYIFLAKQVNDSTRAIGDEEEHGIETHWFTETEIKTMIKLGQIIQKNALAALALYFSSLD